MADLLRKPGATKVPLYLVFSAAWLLKEGDVREADTLVKQLEKLQPDTVQTAELKAKVFAARKDLPSARSVLLAKAQTPGAPIGVLARMCEEIGLYPEAEQLFKRFVEENKAARPQATLTLAAFYGRRGQTADALQVCDAARATVPAPVVGEVAIHALYAVPTPDPADVTKVAQWLGDAAGKSQGKTRAALFQQLASLRNLQGEYATAADLYHRALEEDGKDVLAMNNLAFLLSVREGKHDDALQMLDRAKKIIGPDPNLLDTEAIVRLKKGEVAAARKLLEEVLASTPTASGYFHLAQVEHKAERKLEARVAWQRAEELELRKADLHPLEREAYDQLSRLLK
jgi:tetratricopeptide (TPR) repeat protein